MKAGSKFPSSMKAEPASCHASRFSAGLGDAASDLRPPQAAEGLAPGACKELPCITAGNWGDARKRLHGKVQIPPTSEFWQALAAALSAILVPSAPVASPVPQTHGRTTPRSPSIALSKSTVPFCPSPSVSSLGFSDNSWPPPSSSSCVSLCSPGNPPLIATARRRPHRHIGAKPDRRPSIPAQGLLSEPRRHGSPRR